MTVKDEFTPQQYLLFERIHESFRDYIEGYEWMDQEEKIQTSQTIVLAIFTGMVAARALDPDVNVERYGDVIAARITHVIKFAMAHPDRNPLDWLMMEPLEASNRGE